jgi:hypothetical protein
MWAGILGNSLRGHHILRAHVCSRDYFYFLRTQISGLLEDVSIRVFICALNTTVFHNIVVVKCVSGALKIILNAEMVASVKLQLLGLQFHLT